MLQKTGNVRIT